MKQEGRNEEEKDYLYKFVYIKVILQFGVDYVFQGNILE